ncbi:MAG: CaiB/BaiF CoA transferase family protein [Granulosicoccus sp.]
MPHQPASSVLQDVRVLDLTRVRSGPTAARQLADWGADVIKIEQPVALEADGALGAARDTSDFQNLQRNKRSLTLNLKEPEGLELFGKLVRDADVLIENFRPDVKNRLGIDYESLQSINPRLIYASISGFGQDGPYAKRPGFDQIAQGMGGLMSITGAPDEGPMRVGIPIADLCAGHFCAQGILLALYERERSGKGQWLHTSLLQAMIAMLDFQAARWVNDNEVPKQAGNDHPTSIPTGVFATSDGYINIAVAGEATWERFCKALGKPEWFDHSDYRDSTLRSNNRKALNAAINAVTEHYDSSHWIDTLSTAGVPCGSIYSIDQTFADPQVEHLKMSQKVMSDSLGELNLISQPVVLDRTPSSIRTAPPERGQHTQELLLELGYSGDEISDLQTRNII